MRQFLKEVDANFGYFSNDWFDGASEAKRILEAQNARFLTSYRRIVSLQAWRNNLLEAQIEQRSLDFFLEAQNDALVSHVTARLGSWRTALKALRSCIENVLSCLYYKDHPVELELWTSGKHRLGFSDLHNYFSQHPKVIVAALSNSGLDAIKTEYATLSKAVHASAVNFRMTQSVSRTLLWSPTAPQLGSWSTREGHTLAGLNMLLLTLYRAELGGTKQTELRRAVSLVVGPSRHAAIKRDLGVSLFAIPQAAPPGA